MNSTAQSMPVATPAVALQKPSYFSHTWLRLSTLLNLYFSKPSIAANDDVNYGDNGDFKFNDEHEDMMNYR